MVYGGNGDFWKGDRENLFLTSPPTNRDGIPWPIVISLGFALGSN